MAPRPGQPPRRRLPPVLRRDSILEAAIHAFAQKGYLGTTTRDLARAAGVSEVTLFRHFASKREIFRRAMATHSPIARLGSLPLEGPPRQALAATGLLLLRALVANQAALRIMLGEAGRHPEVGGPVFAALGGSVLSPLEKSIARWQGQGLIRTGSPALLARAFIGMFFYYFLTEVFFRRRSLPPARQARAAAEFVTTFLEGTKR